MNTLVASRLVLRSRTHPGCFGIARVPFFAFCLGGWS